MKKLFLFITPFLFLTACSENESLTDHEIHFAENPNYEDNGIGEISYKGELIFLDEEKAAQDSYTIPRIEKKIEDITFRAKRIPMDLYLLNQGVAQEDLDSVLATVGGEQIFYFEFEEKQKQDLMKKYFKGNMDESISYISFGIQKDFKLKTEDGQVYDCLYSIYERDFGVAPYERLLLGFKGIEPKEEITLLYQDILFQKGDMKFSFASTNYIENNIKNPS
ncbi:MAG: hypothetical protein MI810_01920 [Flavobacteriales bacterium]|nr:hypothetical protein [Flavobacteriales bacterium]